jgi:N-acetylglutamate synthase
MSVTFRRMTAGDARAAVRFWNGTPGMRTNDTPALIRQILRRNPGGSFVALDGKTMIGAILGTQDGRRGMLWHLAVAKPYRRRGLGAKLVARAVAELRKEGIPKVNILVLDSNLPAVRFWKRQGWSRIPVSIYTRPLRGMR